MSTELPGPAPEPEPVHETVREHEHEHVRDGEIMHAEKAVIDVGQAELYISPGARQAAHRLAYALVVLFAFVIAIGAANLLFTSSQVHQVRAAQEQAVKNAGLLQKQLRADCGQERDLAGLPLTNLADGHPSELGVRIVSDARLAWVGHSCPGHLPPPTRTFIAGAHFYHLPVVRAGG